MNSVQLKLLLPVLVVIVLGLCFTSTNAQTPSVEATLNFADYDVIYLVDFIDMKTQKMSSTIPSITLDLIVKPETMSAELPVCLKIEVYIQLRGDASLQKMVGGYTATFSIKGRRTLTARDFTSDGPLPLLDRNGYEENKALRKRLEDLATTIPTAPPGTYLVSMTVYSPDKRIQYGSASKTIVIPYSAPDEAFVEINEPKNGSFFTNLAPTFSWTTSANSVKVSVFEAGVNHRSPQDALTGGNPYLVKELTGKTSFTYQDASRQLQENKAYVLQVEANVSTNRGNVGNASRPVVFRITSDNVGKILDNYFSNAPGSASGTFSSLRADPSNWVAWQDYGNITLDGSLMTETDLQTLLHDLAGTPDLNLQLSVENQ